jgi:hypothetical protein
MILQTARRILIVLILVCLAESGHAQSKVGTSAAAFLGIAVGPRAVAEGGAFVAVANDASALYWNPGGLSRYGRSEVLFSHTNWLVGTNFDWAGVLLNLDGTNAVGVSFTQLSYGDELVTTETSQMGTGQTWSASDVAIGLTYARNLTDRFSIGGTAKYVQQRIYNETASSAAVDVGLLYITDFSGLKIGMCISNYGADMRLDGKDLYHPIDLDPSHAGTNKTLIASLKTDSWPLPLFFRAGVSIDAFKSDDLRLSVAADALRPSDNAETVSVGGELSWNEILFLRAGRKSLFLVDSQEGYTLGGGARWDFSAAMGVGLDYSYEDFGLFGGIQQFALSITF